MISLNNLLVYFQARSNVEINKDHEEQMIVEKNFGE
jgi:hypothetical protein